MKLKALCSSFLVLSCVVAEINCITNQEFFDLVKNYAEDLEPIDSSESSPTNDVDEEVIELPGNGHDDLDIPYLISKLDFSDALQELKSLKPVDDTEDNEGDNVETDDKSDDDEDNGYTVESDEGDTDSDTGYTSNDAVTGGDVEALTGSKMDTNVPKGDQDIDDIINELDPAHSEDDDQDNGDEKNDDMDEPLDVDDESDNDYDEDGDIRLSTTKYGRQGTLRHLDEIERAYLNEEPNDIKPLERTPNPRVGWFRSVVRVFRRVRRFTPRTRGAFRRVRRFVPRIRRFSRRRTRRSRSPSRRYGRRWYRRSRRWSSRRRQSRYRTRRSRRSSRSRRYRHQESRSRSQRYQRRRQSCPIRRQERRYRYRSYRRRTRRHRSPQWRYPLGRRNTGYDYLENQKICHLRLQHTFKMNLDETPFIFRMHACLNLAFLPNNDGLAITLSNNNGQLIHKEISLASPPALCFPVPFLQKIAHACVDVYQPGADKEKKCLRLTTNIDLKVQKYRFLMDLWCGYISSEFAQERRAEFLQTIQASVENEETGEFEDIPLYDLPTLYRDLQDEMGKRKYTNEIDETDRSDPQKLLYEPGP